MAPTRGFRRALIAVAATIAATIIAIRFALHQRSVGESTTEPAKPTVRAQPVRAQPRQNTTDAPPPPKKKKKVAVFYNVYAPPRPHNRMCTSSKTWHKDGEPDKNCAWIGSSPKLAARRCLTTSRSAITACGCECANVSTIRAAEIVDDRHRRTRGSSRTT